MCQESVREIGNCSSPMKWTIRCALTAINTRLDQSLFQLGGDASFADCTYRPVVGPRRLTVGHRRPAQRLWHRGSTTVTCNANNSGGDDCCWATKKQMTKNAVLAPRARATRVPSQRPKDGSRICCTHAYIYSLKNRCHNFLL